MRRDGPMCCSIARRLLPPSSLHSFPTDRRLAWCASQWQELRGRLLHSFGWERKIAQQPARASRPAIFIAAFTSSAPDHDQLRSTASVSGGSGGDIWWVMAKRRFLRKVWLHEFMVDKCSMHYVVSHHRLTPSRATQAWDVALTTRTCAVDSGPSQRSHLSALSLHWYAGAHITSMEKLAPQSCLGGCPG